MAAEALLDLQAGLERLLRQVAEVIADLAAKERSDLTVVAIEKLIARSLVPRSPAL